MGLSVMPGVRLAVGAISRSAVYPDTKANARLDARLYAGPNMGPGAIPDVRIAAGENVRSDIKPDTRPNVKLGPSTIVRSIARLDTGPYASPNMGVDVMPDAESVVGTIPRSRPDARPDLRLDITLDARADVRLNVWAAVGLYARPARRRTNTGRYTSIMPVLRRL